MAVMAAAMKRAASLRGRWCVRLCIGGSYHPRPRSWRSSRAFSGRTAVAFVLFGVIAVGLVTMSCLASQWGVVGVAVIFLALTKLESLHVGEVMAHAAVKELLSCAAWIEANDGEVLTKE
jgi:cytochrome b561